MLGLQRLRGLAGEPPTDSGWNETCRIRWDYYRALRSGAGLNSRWVMKQMTAMMGWHPLNWKVVGITRRALDSLAGPEGGFTHPRGRGLYHRSHLFPRRDITRGLLEGGVMGLDEFTRWTWDRDLTVISMTDENKLLETEEGFNSLALTFSNPGWSLFNDDGNTSWVYGQDERQFLRSIKKPANVLSSP